jgi:outer membrane cobalamin receptor
LRYTFIYIVVFISLPLRGQLSLSNDTVRIGEVIISSKKTIEGTAGYKKTSIDTTVLRYNSHSSLADILTGHSLIFVKSYGMGGTASPSFRGTGAGHTLLTWNDININQPMSGQSDLALVPAGFIDDIQIFYGGASMPISSGGIGGIINLETRPVWKKETLVSVNPGIGSFGQYTGLVKFRTGSQNFQTVTKAFYQSSENDFPYQNTEISNEPVWQTRTNSQVSQKGFIQELYLRKAKSIATARIWYGSTHRNLPSSLLTQQPDLKETQSDESLRAMIDYNLTGRRNNYCFTGAWLLSNLNYTNSLASINSHNFSESMILKAELEHHVGEYTRLRVFLNEELNYIKSNNYSDVTKRNTVTLTGSAERSSGKRLDAILLVREILDNNNFLVPDFSAGLQFRVIEGKDYYLKTNLSRNSKVPVMNDMYWMPGGNPDLKNEYALTYELTGEVNQKISSLLMMKYDVSLYRNNIKDMIQWYPGEYSYWTAGNIKNVVSSGLESSVSVEYSYGKFSAGLNANYSYTKATTSQSDTPHDASVGKQLIYVPVNQANCNLLLTYGIFYTSWLTSMTGQRFLTSDNSAYLPGYMLNNLITGLRWNFKGNSLDINFHIDNLFNTNYQTIAYYPLPGRSYSLKLLIQILK